MFTNIEFLLNFHKFNSAQQVRSTFDANTVIIGNFALIAKNSNRVILVFHEKQSVRSHNDRIREFILWQTKCSVDEQIIHKSLLDTYIN